MKYLILLFLLFSTYFLCQSQVQNHKEITSAELPISDILLDLEKKYNVKFSYPSNLISEKKATILTSNKSIEEVLFEIEVIANIQFEKLSDTYYYITTGTRENITEIVINSYLTRGISKAKNGSYSINPKRFDLLAGLTETDILESIQQLPGVISLNETATGLSVRGGTNDQNRIIWDDINIYHSGHLYGMVSVFNPNVAQKITFYNKGSNVRYGERVASVIDIKTAGHISNNLDIQTGINGINADILIDFPIIKDKLSFQTSFRRSHEDFYETPTFIKYEEKAFQNTIIDDESFHFKDYNFKLNFQPNTSNLFSISAIHIDNDLINNFHNENLELTYLDDLDTENQGLNLQWNKNWNSNLSQNTSFTFSYYNLDYQLTTTDSDNTQSIFIKQNKIFDNHLFTEFNLKIDKDKTFDFGYQFIKKDVSFLFKETKDIIYILDRDDSVINNHALYGAFTYQNKKINLYTGLRLNYFDYLNTLRFEPRMVLNKKINDSFSFQITSEFKNQIISQIDESVLSNLSLENKIWRLANGDEYPIIKAFQSSTGIIYQKNRWTVDLDLFYKNTSGISALSLGFLNPLDNNIHTGKQKTVGYDLYIKKELQNISTWFSYSFLDVKNKYEGLNNNKYFAASTEIKHALSTNISYKKNQFQLAATWMIRSGKPFTDIDIDSDGNSYFNGINTENLPVYHRLDFSTTYKFLLSKKHSSRGKIGFSLRNIYNRQNLIGIEYSGNNTIDDPISKLSLYSIGITPNIMFRVFF